MGGRPLNYALDVMRAALPALLLTGCMYAQVARIDEPGKTGVHLSDLDDGRPAVVMYFVTPERGEPLNFDESRRSFSLRPGRYRINLNCYRSGGVLVADGSDTATIDVPGGGPYVLDCAPANGRNNFALRPIPRDDV